MAERTCPNIFQSYRVMIIILLKWAFVAGWWWGLVYLYAQGIDLGF